MIRNIFPLILLFIFVSPISRTQQKDGETFPLHNFKTLVTLSSQSSKILADFQGKDKMDTQRNESSPRALIHYELDNNRINNLEIDDVKESTNSLNKSSSEIEKKALIVPQKTSRAFLMLVHKVSSNNEALNISNESYPNSGHLIVDRVIELPSLPSIVEWEKWGMN